MKNALPKKQSCIVLMGRKKHLNASALLFLKQLLEIKAVVEDSHPHLDEDALIRLQPGFVLSFLNEKLLKGPLLAVRNVNFHPAPPEWPGRGGASLALYHQAESFGATAHVMESGVDSGPILAVQRFNILQSDTCESLFDRAEHACLNLLYTIGTYIWQHGNLPEPSGQCWKGRPMSRKQFNKWLELDTTDPQDFTRKIRASAHSQYPGPYLIIHGYKFGLVGEQDE
jgi:methionyl-tRNA formyltransferase